MPPLRNYVKFEGLNSKLIIRRPRPGVVLAIFEGHDTGEFGDAPFRELALDLHEHPPLHLFVDGRATPAASLDVSGAWARWMRDHKDALHRLDILVGSRFLQITAEFASRFSGFEERMRIYTEPEAFETELAAVAN